MADYSSGYWTDRLGGRVSRRRMLTAAGSAGIGLAGAALIGASHGRTTRRRSTRSAT